MKSRLDFVAALRIAYWRCRGIEIPARTVVAAGVSINRGFLQTRGRIQISARCELGQGAILNAWGGSIILQQRVFLGPYAVVYGHGGVEIGECTLVSMHCRILSSNHTVPPTGIDIRSQPDVPLPTRIGRDVWLGAGATVLGGVTIGDGSVVGAGAVVTRNIPPYSIATGVPARVTARRSEAST